MVQYPKKCRQGRLMNEKFIARIYEENRLILMKLAYEYVRNESDCEDLLHDCMLRALDEYEQIIEMSASERRSFLKKTMAALCRSHIKENSKHPSPLLYESYTYGIEIYTERKMKLESVLYEIKNLPERDRQMLVMKYILNMKDRDIAPLIGVSENSVRMTVRRSAEKLRKMIEK